MKHKATVTMEVDVEIFWDDDQTDEYGDAVDPRRSVDDQLFYAEDRHDVLEHLAFNAVFNGASDGRFLDGWAGERCPDVRMEAIRVPHVGHIVIEEQP